MEVSPSATSVAHTNGVVLRSVESVPRFTADIIPRIISAARLTRSVLRFSGVQRETETGGGGDGRDEASRSARPQISIETEVDDDDARQESKSTRQIGGNTVGTSGGEEEEEEEKERKRGTR